MQSPAVLIAMILAGYIVGSIPFGLLIARSKGIDIRQHGSKNIGATNVGRVLGKKFFFICFFLDMLKGLIPTLAFGLINGLVRTDAALTPTETWPAALITGLLAAIVIYKHRGNLKRALSGTEPKVGQRVEAKPNAR